MNIWEKFWHKTLHRPYYLNVPYDEGVGRSLVLLHGIGQSAERWRPLIDKIDRQKWRVVALDLFGFGQSPKPNWTNYDVTEHAQMVLATLKRLKLKKPITIVGHSMGCLVAVHIATKYPGTVERLVLYQPPLFGDDPAYRRHYRRRGRYFALYKFVADRPQLAFLNNQFLWKMARRITGLHLNEESWTPFERSLRHTILDQTAYNELRRIDIPTDIIHGRLDMVVTRAQINKMFAHNKKIALHLTNDFHDITPRAATFIAKLINPLEPDISTMVR